MRKPRSAARRTPRLSGKRPLPEVPAGGPICAHQCPAPEAKKNWWVRGVFLVIAIACGYWGAENLADEANPSSSGVLRMALPDDETLPKPEWMLKVEFAEASPPELSADATAGLVEVGLNHVATLTATPCPGPAILMSEAAASADVDPGMPTQHQPSCSLTDKEDRGLTIETQPGLDLGVTRLQLFRPVGLGSSPALEVELIPLGPSHLAVVAGKSLDQETEIVTWPENPVDLQILNGTSYRLRSAEQGRVVARGVNGKEARASLRWQRAPATLFRSVRLKKLSARLSAASQFAWLDQNYDYAHGELTITAPDLEATIGSGCDGKCIEVRYTAGQATLEARGIPIEKRGPGWKKLQAAAAAAGLALGFLGLLL